MTERERLARETELFASLIERAREQHEPDWMLELLVEQLELRRECLAEALAPQSTAIH